MGDLGKLIVAKGFEKLPKVQYIAQSGHTDHRILLNAADMEAVKPSLSLSFSISICFSLLLSLSLSFSLTKRIRRAYIINLCFAMCNIQGTQ